MGGLGWFWLSFVYKMVIFFGGSLWGQAKRCSSHVDPLFLDRSKVPWNMELQVTTSSG